MKQKIIIFISFLSISGISFFSWRTIAKDQQKDNSRPIVHQEKKKKDLPKIIPDDHQKNSRFLFWIIIVIILLLATTIIIYVFIKRNGNANKGNKHANDPLKNKPPENIDNHSPKGPYDNWVYGINIEDGKMQLILCEQWDMNLFIEQNFDCEVKHKLKTVKNDELKNFYLDAQKNKAKICNYLRYHLEVLNYFQAPLLKKIQEIKDLLPKKNNDQDVDYEDLLQLTSVFDQESQNKPDNSPMILVEYPLMKDDQCSILRTTEDDLVDCFDNCLSWKFFQLLMKRNEPVAYYYKKNKDDKEVIIDPLFKYSHAFHQLTHKIVVNLEQFVYGPNVTHKIINDNVANKIKTSLNNIENLVTK